MYAQLIDDAVAAYPVDVRQAHPNTSFPSAWPGGEVDGLIYVLVAYVTPPAVDYTQTVTETTPAQIDGVWSQVWTVAPASQDVIDQRLVAQWSVVRADRNQRLASCDWTQLPDSPLSVEVKAQWATYRQALRDVTQQPNPFAIVWPTTP